MLENLKKYFSANADNIVALATDNQEETVEMTTQTENAPTVDLAEQLATSQLNFVELQAQFAAMTAELATLKEVKEQMVAQAAAKQLQARKESLEMAVGSVKASTLLSTLSVLDDAAFATVVESMTVNLEAEAASPKFQEAGVAAEVDASKLSSLETKLKAKYKKQ